MDLYWQLFFSSIRQHTRWPRDWSSRRVLFRSLKKAIDWFSRGDLTMQNKPTFIIGASMGALGTVRDRKSVVKGKTVECWGGGKLKDEKKKHEITTVHYEERRKQRRKSLSLVRI